MKVVAEVVFLDATVTGYTELVASIDPRAELYTLDAGSDGVQQTADVLSGLENVDAIHILSHGTSEQLSLGNTALTLDSMAAEHNAALTAMADPFLTPPGTPNVAIWAPYDHWVGDLAGPVIDPTTFALDGARWSAAVEGGSGDKGLFFHGAKAMTANGGKPVNLASGEPSSPSSSVASG